LVVPRAAGGNSPCGGSPNGLGAAAGHPVSFILLPVQSSDTWQLVINTGTTIVTFLMVFLIQNNQNRQGAVAGKAR
jgi:low affinity Fe/Cu permease